MSDNPKCETCRWWERDGELSRNKNFDAIDRTNELPSIEFVPYGECHIVAETKLKKPDDFCGQHSELTAFKEIPILQCNTTVLDWAVGATKGLTEAQLAEIGLQRIPEKLCEHCGFSLSEPEWCEKCIPDDLRGKNPP